MIRLAVSQRCIARQVGGNSTYLANVTSGLSARPDYELVPLGLPVGKRPVAWALAEAVLHPRRARDADVLWYPTDTGAGLRAGIPTVATVHGCASLHIPRVRSPIAERAWRARVRRTAVVSDRIITGTRSVVADVVDLCGVSPDRVHVIHHGVDHGRFNPQISDGERELLRSRHGVPDEPFALWMGMLDPKKNLSALVEAFEHPPLEQVHLVIAGGPAWDAAPLVARIRRAEERSRRRIRWIGRVPDGSVAALMRAASVFCFPSRYEGFGMPVLEAQACGTPVVASNAGALSEILDSSAVIVDVTDRDGARSLAEETHRVLADSSRACDLSRAGLANAARFRWERSVEEHAAIFAELIETSPARV